jgi:integrase
MDESPRRRGRPPAPPQTLPLFLHQVRTRVKRQVVISSYTARELRSYIDWAARVTFMSADEVMARTVDHALAQHFKRDVDSARNTLAEAKTFLAWALTKRWARTNALAGVKGVGKRRRGKPQLTVDEARKWTAVGMEMAETEDGAVAALMALLMGMRVSEIADRIVRNLDDDGRLIWITDAKTQAGIRRLQVPRQLQPLLKRVATNKQPGDRLFGPNTSRYTVLRYVRRICRAAGVPVVPPHGLRGTHASLAMTAGATGDLVAAALGHESFTTTERHYARPEAIADAQQSGALRELEKKFPGVPAGGLTDPTLPNYLNLCGRGESNSHNLTITRT